MTCRHSPVGGYLRAKYGPDEIDCFVAHSRDLDRNYLIPIEVAGDRSGMHLRLAPARNRQRAGVHFAADYTLAGAVAQLEERRRGTAEAGGSSPPSSTLVRASQGAVNLGATNSNDATAGTCNARRPVRKSRSASAAGPTSG